MKTSYDILDSCICVNTSHTQAVRMQTTCGLNQQQAIQWIFPSGRVTDFSGDSVQCLKINALVADLCGDMSLLSTMNEFISTHTL